MKQKSLSALLLTCTLLCAGCGDQSSTSSSADIGMSNTEPAVSSVADTSTPDTEPPVSSSADTSTPDTEAPVSSSADTDPETTESAADTSSLAVTEAKPEAESLPATAPPQDSQTADEESLYQSVMIKGQFTATVRALMPDYVYDDKTVQAAVLQLFQDMPFFISMTPEICAQLTVGETYVFQISEQELITAKINLYEDGILSPNAIIRFFPYVDSVRAPQDDEIGLDTWNVTYTPVS